MKLMQQEKAKKSFLYTFEIHWEMAGKISVAGEFNGWNCNACELTKDNKTNIWSR